MSTQKPTTHQPTTHRTDPDPGAEPLASTAPVSSPSNSAGLEKLIHHQQIIEGKEALAEAFDVSITTIERWIREGVPTEPRADENSWVFHRNKVARWRREVHGQETE